MDAPSDAENPAPQGPPPIMKGDGADQSPDIKPDEISKKFDWKGAGMKLADIVQGASYGYTGNQKATRLETETATKAQDALVEKNLKFQNMRDEADKKYSANMEKIRADLQKDLQVAGNQNQIDIAKMNASENARQNDANRAIEVSRIEASKDEASANRKAEMDRLDKTLGATAAGQLGSSKGYMKEMTLGAKK
jgi:hypothetical protein